MVLSTMTNTLTVRTPSPHHARGATGTLARMRSSGGSSSSTARRTGTPLLISCKGVQARVAVSGGSTNWTPGSTSGLSRWRRRSGCWRRTPSTATGERSSPASSQVAPTTPSRTTGTSSRHAATVTAITKASSPRPPMLASACIRHHRPCRLSSRFGTSALATRRRLQPARSASHCPSTAASVLRSRTLVRRRSTMISRKPGRLLSSWLSPIQEKQCQLVTSFTR